MSTPPAVIATLLCNPTSAVTFSPNFTFPRGVAQPLTFQSVSLSNGTTLAAASVALNFNGQPWRPRAAFFGHLHASPCAVNQGGGHWKVNPSINTTVVTNEFWMQFPNATNAQGFFTGAPFMVGPNQVPNANAVAFVVHDVNNAKLACCDTVFYNGSAPTSAPTTAGPTAAPTNGGAVARLQVVVAAWASLAAVVVSMMV